MTRIKENKIVRNSLKQNQAVLHKWNSFMAKQLRQSSSWSREKEILKFIELPNWSQIEIENTMQGTNFKVKKKILTRTEYTAQKQGTKLKIRRHNPKTT